MMDTAQPGLEIREYEMNNVHEFFGHLRISPLRHRHVVIVVLGKPCVTTPIIGDDSGARCHDVFDEATKRIGTPVRHLRKSDMPGIATVPTVIERAVAFAVPYFDSSGHQSLVVHASPVPASSAAHIGFVSFDVLIGMSTDSVLIWALHADMKLVEYLKSGLVFAG